MTALLEVTGLHHQFRTARGMLHAIRGVDFEVSIGETLALVGESGSGKSTTARAVLRLVEPTAGSVRINGTDILSARRSEVRRARSAVQMVFQDPYSSLDPRMTALQSVLQPLSTKPGLSRRERRARAEGLLETVGIGGQRASVLPGVLSGGQRQRVAIARALALEPALLVCDEAVSALDVSIQAQVLNLLGDLQTKLGVSYLFITHDLAVVSEIADRIAVMYLGRIVEIGTREDVLARPLHPYTEALLRAAPHLSDGTYAPLSGEPPSAIDPPPGCSFASRCPRATKLCRTEDPVLLQVSVVSASQVACHYPVRS